MHESWRHGYIATVTLPDGRCGGILDLRCDSAEVAGSQEFRDLAQGICEVLVQYSPRYLDRSTVPPQAAEQVHRDSRLEALRRGIPDDDLEIYAEAMAIRILADLCLLELPLGGDSVGAALDEFGRRVGQGLEVRRFHRMSLDD